MADPTPTPPPNLPRVEAERAPYQTEDGRRPWRFNIRLLGNSPLGNANISAEAAIHLYTELGQALRDIIANQEEHNV